jgi:hypothetical protein
MEYQSERDPVTRGDLGEVAISQYLAFDRGKNEKAVEQSFAIPNRYYFRGQRYGLNYGGAGQYKGKARTQMSVHQLM